MGSIGLGMASTLTCQCGGDGVEPDKMTAKWLQPVLVNGKYVPADGDVSSDGMVKVYNCGYDSTENPYCGKSCNDDDWTHGYTCGEEGAFSLPQSGDLGGVVDSDDDCQDFMGAGGLVSQAMCMYKPGCHWDSMAAADKACKMCTGECKIASQSTSPMPSASPQLITFGTDMAKSQDSAYTLNYPGQQGEWACTVEMGRDGTTDKLLAVLASGFEATGTMSESIIGWRPEQPTAGLLIARLQTLGAPVMCTQLGLTAQDPIAIGCYGTDAAGTNSGIALVDPISWKVQHEYSTAALGVSGHVHSIYVVLDSIFFMVLGPDGGPYRWACDMAGQPTRMLKSLPAYLNGARHAAFMLRPEPLMYVVTETADATTSPSYVYTVRGITGGSQATLEMLTPLGNTTEQTSGYGADIFLHRGQLYASNRFIDGSRNGILYHIQPRGSGTAQTTSAAVLGYNPRFTGPAGDVAAQPLVSVNIQGTPQLRELSSDAPLREPDKMVQSDLRSPFFVASWPAVV